MEPEGSLPPSRIQPLVPILSRMNPFHTLPSNFFKIHSNIILSSMPSSSKCSLSLTFSRNPLYISVLICPARLTLDNTGCPRRNVPDFGRVFLMLKVYRYNPKHLCPKLNGYRDNGHRKLWSSGRSMHCTCQLTTLSMPILECGFILWQFSSCSP